MTVAEALKQARGSCIKMRRVYMKANRMTEREWYEQWHVIGAELEALLS